jgi:hypothetical protein
MSTVPHSTLFSHQPSALMFHIEPLTLARLFSFKITAEKYVIGFAASSLRDEYLKKLKKRRKTVQRGEK